MQIFGENNWDIEKYQIQQLPNWNITSDTVYIHCWEWLGKFDMTIEKPIWGKAYFSLRVTNPL